MANRLLRESLVAEVMLPSPFKSHKGADLAHFQITAAGLEALRAAKEPK